MLAAQPFLHVGRPDPHEGRTGRVTWGSRLRPVIREVLQGLVHHLGGRHAPGRQLPSRHRQQSAFFPDVLFPAGFRRIVGMGVEDGSQSREHADDVAVPDLPGRKLLRHGTNDVRHLLVGGPRIVQRSLVIDVGRSREHPFGMGNQEHRSPVIR